MIIPPDLSKQRINVGVRTFAAATIAVTVSDQNGRFVGSRPLLRTIPAAQFQQYALQDFLGGGVAIPAGGSIRSR